MDTTLPWTAFFNPVAMFAMTTVPAAAPPPAEHKENEQSSEDQPDQPTSHHHPASFLGPFVFSFFFSPIDKECIRHAIFLVSPCLLIIKDLRSKDDLIVAT
jgi:hypothetical protein